MFNPLPLFDAPEPRMDLSSIKADLGDCTRCKLFRSRRNIVFGQGNPNAQLFFLGEAPGENEDSSGIAFVGRAGQLLTEILASVGIDRDTTYIANCVKCRPPGNRKPEPEEILACRPFLEKQIKSIRPRVIVALGGYAAQWLLGGSGTITKVRGRIWSYGGMRVVPTFHPAYLLRSPDETKKVKEDLLLAVSLLKGR